ncbi:unnamed protein product [Camellia sinensis]
MEFVLPYQILDSKKMNGLFFRLLSCMVKYLFYPCFLYVHLLMLWGQECKITNKAKENPRLRCGSGQAKFSPTSSHVRQ